MHQYKKINLVPTPSVIPHETEEKQRTTLFRLRKDMVLLINQDHVGQSFFDASSNVVHYISRELHDVLLANDGKVTLEDLRSLTGFRGLTPAVWDEFVNSGLFLTDEPTKRDLDTITIPSVQLDLSASCNLACLYCYSDARAKRNLLPRTFYEVAIQELLKGLQERPDYFLTTMMGGRQRVGLMLIGGGEPTFDTEAFAEAVAVFRDLVVGAGMKPTLSLMSNGTFDEAVLNILVENKATVQVSLDGLPHIQDRQRSFRGGAPSYKVVIGNIRRLVDAGCQVRIRSTITANSLPYMEELLDLAIREAVPVVHMEPVARAGRASRSQRWSPAPEDFGREIGRVFVLGHKAGITVRSGYLPIILPSRNTHCGACGGSRIVTTEGCISTCLEVTRSDHPMADNFIVGQIDTVARKSMLWEPRIRALAARTLDNLPSCQDCFLRYNCIGHCPAEAIRVNGDIFQPDSAWCEVARSSSLSVIDQLLGQHDIRMVS
jgi:uncharacterized protein